MSNATHHARLLSWGQVLNHYQPIVNLQSGALLGVEVLGRLIDGPNIISPGVFLPSLDVEQLGDLLFKSLADGLTTLAACDRAHPSLFMSFNVSPSVMVRPGFVAKLLRQLQARDVAPRRITLEILEDDEFLSMPAACRVIGEIKAAGVCIAIDDLGTGYSSLSRLQALAVDKIKLDQVFVRGLRQKPEGLHFVAAMQALARGLHGTLVVEGVETAEIMSALGVLGVQAVQGYAIARPMPSAALIDWAARFRPVPIDRQPQNLLGAYAAHISIVETCRALVSQPLRFAWAPDIRDPHACPIGRYFDTHGLHETPFGRAHQRLHEVIDQYGSNPEGWEKATLDLWTTLQAAIKAEAGAEAGADAGCGVPDQHPVPAVQNARCLLVS